MIGRFENILDYLKRRHRTTILQEYSTGNFYRIGAIEKALQVDYGQPGYNPNLRFAECEYRDAVYQGTQGFIFWVVPNGWTPQTGQPLIPANPGQRLTLYRVATTQQWQNPPGWWIPDLQNSSRK